MSEFLSGDDGPLEVSVWDQSFRLGDLVDMTSMKKPIPSGRSLWSQKDIKNHTPEKAIPINEIVTEIIKDEDFETQTKKLDITGELKLGLAMNLYQLSG